MSSLLQALENGQFDSLFDLLPSTVDPPLRLGPDQLTPLHYACQYNRLDIVEKLITEYDYNFSVLGGVAPSPLQMAAVYGSTSVVEYILTNGMDSSLKGGVVGPLHLAADNGHLETLKCLVRANVLRISIADGDGNTPLHHACAHGHLHIICYLCDEAKHPLTISNKKGETPLHIAAKHCHTAVVKYLIDEKHCDPAGKDGRVGSTPLHLAAKSGCLDIVKYLANEKACNIESKTYSKNRKRHVSISSGRTPLHYACFGGQKAVVEYLIHKQTCNPRCTDDDGLTPFHLACQEGHLDIVLFFLELSMPEFNTLTTEDGRTLMHCAALCGNPEVLKQLAENTECDLNAVDSEGRTAVHYAARNGCMDTVKMLVEEMKCNVNCVDNAGVTPLHLAAKFGRLETVQYLFSNPLCNCTSTDDHGYTPLHLAAYKGRSDIVCYILSEKLVPVMCRDKTGRTPLHLAAQAGDLEMVKLLASQPECESSGVDKGLKATALHLASGAGHLDIVRYFVEEKSLNPACTDKFNSTPLHRAAASGRLKVVQYLVEEKQVNPVIKNKFGNSPLHLACQKGQLPMVKLLLTYSKENITLRNQVGRTPLDQVTNSDIVGEFLQLGVEPSKNSAVSTRFPYLKHWNQLSPVVKIFILGDSGVGKTTLVKALQGEGFVTEWLSGRFHRIGSGSGELIGINVTSFESRHFGKVVLYDMSGHHGYVASHSAVLKIACCDSVPIFITMVDLRNKTEEIEHSVNYWSHLIEMSLPIDAPRCHGILLGNHENDLSKDDSRQKPALLERATLSSRQVLQYKRWFTIDCRRVASNNMHRLRQLLSQICDDIRSNFKPSFECSLLRSFMQHKFQSPIIIEYRDLQEYIAHSDIPCLKAPETLYKTCQDLHSRGYVLFLPNSYAPDSCWIVLNQEAVFSMIHGFQKHVTMTNKVGLLPVSQLDRTLGAMGFNLMLVIQYFLRMEFCLRVVDRRLLFSIVGFDPPSPMEDHLFFPHLVTKEIPVDIWLPSDEWGMHFGWAMECLEQGRFFTPHFVQKIVLRIAAKFPFNTDPNSTFLTRHQLTHVWGCGLSWADTRGMQVLVTLEHNATRVIVLTRCVANADCEMDYRQLRALVLKEVRSVREDVCLRTTVREFVMPCHMTTRYPLATGPHVMCSMDDVAMALLDDRQVVTCTHAGVTDTPPSHVTLSAGVTDTPPSHVTLSADESDMPPSHVTLNDLVEFEAYSLLGPLLLKDFLVRDNKSEQLSDDDLKQIAMDFSESDLSVSSLRRVLRVTVVTGSLLNSSKVEQITLLLGHWVGLEGCGSVESLLDALNQYSLFAGYPIVVTVSVCMVCVTHPCSY